MIETVGIVLTAFITAFVHSVIPDHWLPFVVMGRNQGWGVKRTVLLAGFSAGIHVVFSMGLGMTAFIMGKGAAVALGTEMEFWGGVFLIIFGVLYPVWDWNWGHHPRHHHGKKLIDQEEHLEWGPLRKDMTGVALAIVLGITPCVLLVPLLVATMDKGLDAAVMVAMSFSLATVSTMMVLTGISFKSIERFHFTFMEKFGGIITGVLLVVIGIVILFLEH